MKNEEATQRIEFLKKQECNENDRIALDMAVDALKKQVPMKSISTVNCCTSKTFLCPKCRNILLKGYDVYCRKCGQAIDWSNEDV